MSIHECPVIQIKLEPHPNADSLSLIRYNGFTIVVRTDEWKNGDLGIHVDSDFICPDRPEFSFLDGHFRIKPKKLRGEWSDGILIKAPEGAKIGDNMMDHFGIKRYDPQIQFTSGGDNESPPKLISPVYDMENYKKYKYIFSKEDEVVVHEKLHGCNSRWVFHEGRMWCGSHRNWKRYDENNLWWKALKLNIWIEEWCKLHGNYIIYSEIYGQVQDLKYGTRNNELRVGVFDIMHDKQYLDYDKAKEIGKNLFWCPELYRGEIDENKFIELAEGNSSVPGADHLREGIVIKTIKEIYDEKIGRKILKLVSSKYLSR